MAKSVPLYVGSPRALLTSASETGPSATDCSTKRLKSVPREPDVRRLNRKRSQRTQRHRPLFVGHAFRRIADSRNHPASALRTDI